MFRKLVMLLFAGGGVMGSLRLLDYLAHQAGGNLKQMTGEGLFFVAVPVAMVGAALGLMVGGILFPPRTT
jgi:hypothetical protein